MKKLISIVLSVALAIVPFGTAWAAEDNSSSGSSGSASAASASSASSASSAAATSTTDRLISIASKWKSDQQPVSQSELEASGKAKSYPSTFDLRDKGYVTPVKSQNPYGTCWGFATVAACETSILSSLGMTYAETGLDLSEHHLTYFTRTPLADGSSQDGEGCYVYNKENLFNTGGFMTSATSVLSSGIGLVTEAFAPYRGKTGMWGMAKTGNPILDFVLEGFPSCYSPEDDWTIDEQYRFYQTYELSETSILPDTAIKNYNLLETSYEYIGYSAEGTQAIKEALSNGQAVSIAFCADQSLPGQTGDGKYISNNWCHYTYDNGEVSHAVTIVGWDDTIQPDQFVDHSGEQGVEGTGQPPAAGAWIVKNSWGATEWGILDENGSSTGYFYLSYYDHSLSLPETFSLNMTTSNATASIIDQYDYLPAGSMTNEGWVDSEELRTANVFTAEADENIYAVSGQTSYQDTTSKFEIYLLNDGATEPTDGNLAATIEKTFDYAGYHQVKLDSQVYVPKGQRYSIVETQTVPKNGTTLYAMNTDRALNEEGTAYYNNLMDSAHKSKYYSKAVVNAAESYIYSGAVGSWADWSQVSAGFANDDTLKHYAFDNFALKSYANFANSSDMLAASSGESADCIYPPVEHDQQYYMAEYFTRLFKIIAIALVVLVIIIVVLVIVIRKLLKKRKAKKLAAAEAEAAEALKREEADDPDAPAMPLNDAPLVEEGDESLENGSNSDDASVDENGSKSEKKQ